MTDKQKNNKNTGDFKSITSAHISLSSVVEELGLAGEAAAKQLMRVKKINIFRKNDQWCIDKGSYVKLVAEHTHEVARAKLVEQNKAGNQERGRE